MSRSFNPRSVQSMEENKGGAAAAAVATSSSDESEGELAPIRCQTLLTEELMVAAPLPKPAENIEVLVTQAPPRIPEPVATTDSDESEGELAPIRCQSVYTEDQVVAAQRSKPAENIEVRVTQRVYFSAASGAGGQR